MKSEDIIKVLKEKYQHPWVGFSELRIGTGYRSRKQPSVQQRIDYFIINSYPSSKYLKISFEIKVSYSDFKHEIDTPKKRQAALDVSNQYYFIAPKGIIPIEEVPPEAGLIEISDNMKSKVIKEAPYRECKTPDWGFFASIARRVERNNVYDPKNLSDTALKSIMGFLQGSGERNVDEENMYLALKAEESKRSIKKYNKEKDANKGYSKFVYFIESMYPIIPLHIIEEFWYDISKKKIRTKKARKEYINSTLTTEQKKKFKGKAEG